jgi:hypothetical protein
VQRLKFQGCIGDTKKWYRMDKNCTDRSFFYFQIPKEKFGLSSLTHSKVIALLNFHVIVWKFVTSYIVVDVKRVKNETMSFKIFKLIISAFRNNVAKLHLHLLHRSGEINNVFKL